MDAYINPDNNHLILVYENGEMIDTDIILEHDNDVQQFLPPYSRISLPTASNVVIYNMENKCGHFIIDYANCKSCDLGELCKPKLCIFSQDSVPPLDCECNIVDASIIFISLSSGGIYIKETDSDVYLCIGNTRITRQGSHGPTGLNVKNVIYQNDYIDTVFDNNTIHVGPIHTKTGPTGTFPITGYIQNDSFYVVYDKGFINNGHVSSFTGCTGPQGATGPSVSISNYNGTGFFGSTLSNVPLDTMIDTLRQPSTFYPTFFGTGINGTLSSKDAIVIGNRNYGTGVNNANYTVSIGYQTGQIDQQSDSIAIGYRSGMVLAGTGSIALGYQVGIIDQGVNTIGIGLDAGFTQQNNGAIAIGMNAGFTGQGTGNIAIGYKSNYSGENANTIAIGYESAKINQGTSAIAIGTNVGYINQGNNSIAIGNLAGYTNQGDYTISVGSNSGSLLQQNGAVAIGDTSGYSYQSTGSIAIGYQSGYTGQMSYSIAIGNQSGNYNQQANTIAIGNLSGNTGQSVYSIAIGNQAGQCGLGSYALAIGNLAGPMNQTTRSLYTIKGLVTLGGSPASLQYNTVTGQIGPLSSSREYKTNTQPITNTNVSKLQSVSFNWKQTGEPSIGMIAEDTYKYHPELTPRNQQGELYTINYELLSVLLLERVKTLDQKLQLQSKLLQKLKSE